MASSRRSERDRESENNWRQTVAQRPRSAAHIKISSYASTQSRPIPENCLSGLGGALDLMEKLAWGKLVTPLFKNTQSSLLTS